MNYLTESNLLLEALEDALGAPAGYLFTNFRQLLGNHPDLALDICGNQITDPDAVLEKVMAKAWDSFEEFIQDDGEVTKEISKADDMSKQYREEGNKEYKARHFGKAVRLYTKAIQYATPSGEALPLAYANRSAVLFQDKKYHDSLLDISRALEAGYPDANKYKLLERRAKIHGQFHDTEQATNALNDLMSALELSQLSDDERSKMASSLTKQIQDSVKNKSDVLKQSKSNDHPQRVSNPNPILPAFSKSVAISYHKERGRHGIAARSISAGEVLGIERPIVSQLFLKELGNFCSHCLSKSDSALPSPFNAKDLFCSELCLKEALSSFHPMESKILGLLIRCGLLKLEWFLALRAVTQKSVEFFKSDIFKSYDTQMGAGSCCAKYETDYKSFYNLVTMEGKREAAGTEVFKAYTIVFLLRLLKKAGYFSNNSWHRKLGADEKLIGKMLWHFMEVSTFNAHEVGFASKNGNVVASIDPIGCSLEPTLVLLNHSCDPNVIRVNNGRDTLMFACRNIAEGEEIFDTYHSMGFQATRSQRQLDLMGKYKFECQCRPCVENWPLGKDMPKSLNDVSPAQFKIALDDVRQMQIQFGKIQTLGAKVNQEQQKGNYKECLPLIIEFIKVLHVTLDPPHQFHVMATKTMINSLWALYGSFG